MLVVSENVVSIHLMLQFIFSAFCWLYAFDCVSIHLMLQFIQLTACGMIAPSVFQYISCCSLSCTQISFHLLLNCFNTSHVVVYRTVKADGRKLPWVSIHLMLQFIQSYLIRLLQLQPVSIHLMLQFINRNQVDLILMGSFQYISCCSLSCYWIFCRLVFCFVSIHLMLQFIQSSSERI